MSVFKVHSIETAPEGAKPLLEAVKKQLGFVPNLMGVFAEAPNVLKSYLELSGNFSSGSLTPQEVQVVALTVSRENGCDYCMAAHSTLAKMGQLNSEVIQALRDGTPIGDTKLAALGRFTELVVGERGNVPEAAIKDFLAAGYTKAAVFEVILGVAMKTLSNYVNHVAGTPVDKAFEPMKWARR